MKLTAGDQMQWAQMIGKDDVADVRVFIELAHKGITAWGTYVDHIASYSGYFNLQYNLPFCFYSNYG
jgi:hypothetical protein